MRKDKARETFQNISRKIDGVEKIIWSYTGAKRCSYTPFGIEKFRLEIHKLSLRIHKGYICQINWPTQDYFQQIEKKYYVSHKVLMNAPPLGYNSDLSAGLFLDIPFCCAETFHRKTNKTTAEFFKKHPFRYPFNDEDLNSYFDEINKHQQQYSYPNAQDEFSESKKMAHFILKGKLPQSAFFLLNNFIPCRYDCNHFISQSQKMNQALVKYLPEELDKIIRLYKKQTEELFVETNTRSIC